VAVLLSPLRIHGCDPTLPGFIDAGVRDQEVISVLDPHGLVIDQYLHGLSPEPGINIEPEVMEPNVARLSDQAGQLAEAEEAPQAAGIDHASLGTPQDDLRGEIVDPALSIAPFMGQVPSELIITYELRMLLIGGGALRTAEDVGIQHPALHGKAAFHQVLPGMPACNGSPTDAERVQTGTQRQKHPGIITDNDIRRAPPRDRLAADLHDAGEVLSVEAARPNDGPAVAVEDEDAVEPVIVDFDEIADISKPDLMRSGGHMRAIIRVGEARGALGCGMSPLYRAPSCQTVVWP
jgi:hypothetical protein